MHQCLIQWIGDAVKVVSADSSFSIASTEAHAWNYEKVGCFSGQAWETDFLKVVDYELTPIQAVGSPDDS